MNSIHSPIYSVNQIFNCLSVILATIIRIALIGMDVKTTVVYVMLVCQGKFKFKFVYHLTTLNRWIGKRINGVE